MKELKVNPVKQSPRLRINKRFYIILICFFISIVFWLLLALSHDYPTMVTFPIKYKNFPGNKVVVNDLPSRITVQLKSSGFKILSLGFQKEREPVEIDVSTSIQNSLLNADIISLPTQTFLIDFSNELGKEVNITGFQPDSIVFNFSDIISKTVPVILPLKVTFEKQYDSTGSPKLVPSEIIVSGPPSVVAGLKSVTTENVVLENLKATVNRKVNLVTNRLLSYSQNEIELTLPVEKFTEGSVEIEVHPVNVSSGFSLKTFPDKVKVRYLVSLSHYNKVDNSMFDAVVDASELTEMNKSKLYVKLMTSPFFVRFTSLEPEKVDYILRKQ